MNKTDLVEQSYLRSDIPEFRPGDTVKVHVRVVEGSRERVQVFQGVVIRRQNGGLRETFTVRKISFGVGVERTFPVHSPSIAKLEVVSRGKVRRAKLYYLRELRGKKARIKERRLDDTKLAALEAAALAALQPDDEEADEPDEAEIEAVSDDAEPSRTPPTGPRGVGSTRGVSGRRVRPRGRRVRRRGGGEGRGLTPWAIAPALPNRSRPPRHIRRSCPATSSPRRIASRAHHLTRSTSTRTRARATGGSSGSSASSRSPRSLIAILIKTFLIQAFFIPSGSMEPTLMPNDRILVNRLAYRFGDIERGDIIVFADPTPSEQDRGVVGSFIHWLGEGIGVARPADDDFIKRVIALPGETWEMRDGVTYVDGRKLDEPYVNQADLDTRSFGPETVPDGMLFVMGDNRNHSGDSRFPPPSGLGYIPIDRVIGQAFVIIWPPSRAGWLH